MKTIKNTNVLFTCIFLSFTIILYGQTTIPNGGFETWTNVGSNTEEPTNWNGNKTGGGFANLGPQTCSQETSGVHSGTYCLKLENGSFFGTPVNATATTGKIEAPTATPADGYLHSVTTDSDFNSPFTGRPDSIAVWVKFTKGGTDTARISCILHDNFNVSEPDQGSSASHIIAKDSVDIPSTISTWTRLVFPLNYLNNNTPSYILLICTASNKPGSANANSVLWVDDMEAIYCSPDNSVTDNGTSLTSNATGAGVTYQWIDCNNSNSPVNGATSATYTPTLTGDYAVEATQNGCTSTSACFNVVITGIDELAFSNNLSIYPNPNKGQFVVDLGKDYIDIELTITDINGRVVKQKNIAQGQILEVDFDKPAGVYFVSVTSQTKHTTVKIIKQ
jgi:hypothetical protein